MPCRMFLDISHYRPSARLVFPREASAVHPEYVIVLTDGQTIQDTKDYLSLLAVSSFNLGQDGHVCVTWGKELSVDPTGLMIEAEGGRACSNTTLLLLQGRLPSLTLLSPHCIADLPIGRVEVKVELIGWDGLPVFASAGSEVGQSHECCASSLRQLFVELAVPARMDWEGLVLDSRSAMSLSSLR
eukprot:765092-Hanusia_phi.AAC.7